jgi:hypothetical protein
MASGERAWRSWARRGASLGSAASCAATESSSAETSPSKSERTPGARAKALARAFPSAAELAWLGGVGLFTQLGQLGLTKGLMGLPAARATALSYVQVPLASLWGLWFFHDQPSPDGLIAALLVLAATVISLRSRPAGARDR